jgi:hypothetical protein
MLALGLLAFGSRGDLGTPVSASQSTRTAHPVTGYGRLPMSFERNQGQAGAQVRFLARGAGYALALTDRGPVLALSAATRRGTGHAAHAAAGAVLATRFVGGRVHAPVGSGRQAGRVNYFIGKDPSKWHTNVPTYAQASYRDVWKGIDVAFHGNQRQIEYDYHLAPGADPRRIAVRMSGARSLRLDPAGNLVISVRGGSLRELAPQAYQTVAGTRRAVASRFAVGADHKVGIRVGAYDPRRPLVIDPALTYSTYLGGSNVDQAVAQGVVAVDGAGSAYVTGTTMSTDFPTSAGAEQTVYGGSIADAVVTKLNPAGTAVVYSTYLGGTGPDEGNAIAVDSAGDAYIAGDTGSGFPVTAGAFQPANGGGGDNDGFVTKLNPAGTALVYSSYLGGSDSDVANGIAVDAAGSAYVTGFAGSSNFPTTPTPFQAARAGADDAFVTEVNPAGTALTYSTYLGGSGSDEGKAIRVDGSGDAYVGGYTSSTDFPTTPGASQGANGGGNDAFVTKVNPAGTALGYSTYLGGTGADFGLGIAVDSAGSAYLIGETDSADLPTTAGVYRTTSYNGSLEDLFVSKLSTAGSLAYSTYLGGTDRDRAGGIAVSSTGAASVTGLTYSTDFPTTPGAYQSAPGGVSDAFVTTLNPTGTALTDSTFLGGTGQDDGSGIALDPAGNVYVAGYTKGDFPTTPGAFQTTYGGGTEDLFVAKFGSAVVSAPPPGQTGPTGTIPKPKPPAPAPKPSPDIAQARSPRCLSIPTVLRDQVKRTTGAGKLTLRTRQVDDAARPVTAEVLAGGGAKIRSVKLSVNGHAVAAAARKTASVGVSLLRFGAKTKVNKVVATVTLTSGKKVVLTQVLTILTCHVPPTKCARKAGGKTVVCSAGTPLTGRRVRVTLLGNVTQKATGSATVSKGKYTVTLHSATALTAGTYAYKHVVTTRKAGQRYFMIRLVKVT